ncbi:MAG: disulfide bond formation protein B [Propionicimonas sp.]
MSTNNTTPLLDHDQTPEQVQSPAVRPWIATLFSEKVFNLALASAALLVMAGPVGIATIYLGFIHGESPCTLCGFERFGMVIVAILAVFILRYGPQRKYLFLLIATPWFYLYGTVIQWMRYAPRDRGQGFAEDVFGVHTYTWGSFVFWIIILAAGVGLLWVGRDPQLREQFGALKPVAKPLTRYSLVSGVVVFAMICLNAVQFFIIDGPPPFTGTGHPPRMTLDITRASQNWSLQLWGRVGLPTLHSYSPPMVHIPGVHTVEGLATGSTTGAPIPTAGTLEVVKSTPLGFAAVGPFGGQAGGIAYDPANQLFGISSTGGGLYFVEDDFKTVRSSAVIDTVNGNNARETVEAMFLGPNQLVGVAWNKTLYGVERVEPGSVDEFTQWKEFRSTTGDLRPLWGSKIRQMLQTIRAKSAYTLSAAFDSGTGQYSVVSVPSPQMKGVVISQFGPDHLLAREGFLKAATDADLDLSGYYPVGATIVDGTMYLLSKTYQSLLVVDLETLTVDRAFELPDLGDYHGIAAAGDSLFILSDVAGTDTVTEVVLPGR